MVVERLPEKPVASLAGAERPRRTRTLFAERRDGDSSISLTP
jgi:hypothetical protein